MYLYSCCNIGKWFKDLGKALEAIQCAVEAICIPSPPDSPDIRNIERMLAHNNPMTIAAEYPHVEGDRFVVSTPVRFLDMLNTNIYVIFKIDNTNYDLPIYFADSAYADHTVVLPDGTPVTPNQLQLNGIYSAKYQYSGSYIILDNLTPLNPDVIPV